MKRTKINDKTGYDETMKRIEKLLQKATKLGGFDKLGKQEKTLLKDYSLSAEKYEDSIPLMPMKAPTTITEMIRYKMFEMNLKQKQLAKVLEISEAQLSKVLKSGHISIELAKKLHFKLNIDAHFILEVA